MALGLMACDDKRSAEAAGKSIDNAVAKTVDGAKSASRTIADESATVGSAISDSAITAKVKAAILAEPGLNVLDIGVETKYNVTTLTGSIDTQKNSAKVEEMTKAVEGVDSVINQLMVVASK
jgi:osmotically-inducible protein OsmY